MLHTPPEPVWPKKRRRFPRFCLREPRRLRGTADHQAVFSSLHPSPWSNTVRPYRKFDMWCGSYLGIHALYLHDIARVYHEAFFVLPVTVQKTS